MQVGADAVFTLTLIDAGVGHSHETDDQLGTSRNDVTNSDSSVILTSHAPTAAQTPSYYSYSCKLLEVYSR